MASGGPLTTSAGALAARAWLEARSLSAPRVGRWHARVVLGTEPVVPSPQIDPLHQTRFAIEIYSEEWGFQFCHGGHASWIRVTDLAFVHGRDDFKLLAIAPPLKDLRTLLRRVERDQAIQFDRTHALIVTNLTSAEGPIRDWVLAM